MMKMFLFFLIFLPVGYLIVGAQNNKCFIDLNTSGLCGPISRKECLHLHPLIPHAKTNSSVRQMFRTILCRFDNNKYGFCCPKLPSQNSLFKKLKQILPPYNECGVVYDTRIIGGEATLERQYPWMAALGLVIFSNFRSTCGGTVITRRHVLTATHCFIKQTKPNLVRTGVYDFSKLDNNMQEFSIVKIIDRGYDFIEQINDITLVVGDRDILFNTHTVPACLPWAQKDRLLENEELTIAGWGETETAGSSNLLLATTVPVVDLNQCKRIYESFIQITENQICAGTFNKDSCTGDSGGPLLLEENDVFYVVGITSFGHPNCGNTNIPGVYTRVTSYLGWIYRNLIEY